jgi:hypothetical protein
MTGSLCRLGAWTGRGLSKTAHSCPFRVAATASTTRIVSGDLAFQKPIGHFCGHRQIDWLDVRAGRPMRPEIPSALSVNLLAAQQD